MLQSKHTTERINSCLWLCIYQMYVVCGCDGHLCRFAHAYKFTHTCMQGGREACTYKHMLKWASGLHSSSSWWVGFSLVFISSIIHCLLKRCVSCSRKSPCLLANKHSHVTHRPLTEFFRAQALRLPVCVAVCSFEALVHFFWDLTPAPNVCMPHMQVSVSQINLNDSEHPHNRRKPV